MASKISTLARSFLNATPRLRRTPTPYLSTAPFSSISSLQSQSAEGEGGDENWKEKGSRRERWRWPALLLFIPGAATFGLTGWQLWRYNGKVEMLEHRRRRLEDEIVPLSRVLEMVLSQQQHEKDAALPSLEFRRVACEGVYDESKSMFVGPRARSNYGITEKGYILVTPLLPSPDNPDSLQLPVLVNRGWVPSSWRDAALKIKSEKATSSEVPSERKMSSRGIWSFLWRTKEEKDKDAKSKVKTAKVVGVIRSSENPNMFVPANVPGVGQWFYVDVPAMALRAGLPENTIYIEAVKEAANNGGVSDFPVAKDPDALLRSPVMPNDHLSYAATWFILSIATTFMAFKRLNDKRIRKV